MQDRGNFVKIWMWETTTVVVEMQQTIAQLSKYITGATNTNVLTLSF